MSSGIIGGQLAHFALGRIGPRDALSGAGYSSAAAKLERLLGPGFFDVVRGRTVLDFGCGPGSEALELARRGAARVIGLDVQERFLAEARRRADAEGLSSCCDFVTQTSQRVDVVLSLDGFEHYGDPAGVLDTMYELLAPGGAAYVAFGPPWLHPLGGHLFSVFPWAHLVFTEASLLAWRARFKHDGATRFSEVAGGLNQMTIARFEELVGATPFILESFECVPIRRVRRIARALPRELFTSVVRAVLRRKTI
jgi:SAM-dependent methyltransferase